MSNHTTLMKFGLLCAVLFASKDALAGPERCSYGFQDSTCAPGLSYAPQAQPTCSTAPGWTTTAPAQWTGSKYSSPQCSYQAAPVCPGGYTQTSSPWWNGSGWVGLACTPSVPPAPVCVDQPVRALMITWANYYGSYWYSEGFVTATRRVCDGVPKWSSLVRTGDDLQLPGPTKAWHVPNLTGPGGVPMFAADLTCYGVSHSFNGENGPQNGQLASPPLATSPGAYGYVTDGSQCGQDTTTD